MSIQTLTIDEISELTKVFGSNVQGLSKDTPRVEAYDFTRPDRLPKIKLRAAERPLSMLARVWAETASAALRMDVSAKIGSIEEAGFDAYEESLPQYCVIAVADTDHTGGCAYLDMDTDLALRIANRLAGGRGDILHERRKLTQIELFIVKRFMSRLCDDISTVLGQTMPVRFTLADIRQSINDVSTIEDAIVVTGMDLRIGAMEYRVNLVLPTEIVESIADSSSHRKSAGQHSTPRNVTPHALEAMLGAVPVPVAADLGHARVTMQELRSMEIGDIIMLDHPVSKPITVRVGKQDAFYSHAGLVGDQLAVQINGGRSEAGTVIADDSAEFTEE